LIDIQEFVSTKKSVTKKRVTVLVSESTHQRVLAQRNRAQQLSKNHLDAPTVDLNAAFEKCMLEVINSVSALFDQFEQAHKQRQSTPPGVQQMNTGTVASRPNPGPGTRMDANR